MNVFTGDCLSYSDDLTHLTEAGFDVFSIGIKKQPKTFIPDRKCHFDVARVILRSEQVRKGEHRTNVFCDLLGIDTKQVNIDNVWGALRG